MTGFYEFQNGQLQERFSNDMGTQRANRSASDANTRANQWMAYAKQLEGKLANSEAQLQRVKDQLTVRTAQNDVHRGALLTLQGELRKRDAAAPLGDENLVRDANREEVDRRLRGTGLWIERTEQGDLIHRG